MDNLKAIAITWLKDRPEHKNGVIKATYAYHLEFYEKNDAHRFSSSQRYGKCMWCGRTREDVRWDVLSPHCLGRPKKLLNIVDVIGDEEERFRKLMERARKFVSNIDIHKLTGMELAKVHHTYGFDPTVTESCLGHTLPESLHQEYLIEYEKHRATGKRGEKKEVIAVVS